MEYKAKSVIIGRIKKAMDLDETEDTRPCFIALYDVNRPHTSGKIPFKILEFVAQKVCVKGGICCDFLLLGKDLMIDNIDSLTILEDHEKKHIVVHAKQHAETPEAFKGQSKVCV